MRKLMVCFVVAVIVIGLPVSAAPRFVIDDDEYVDKVTHASAKLLHEGRLLPLATLQGQVRTKRLAVGLPPVSHQSFSTSDLCDRLRESTLAVGTYYKCPDCGGWHFNSSAGFVVAEGGIVCTCCHVVLAEDKKIKESYLVAADADGRVFPVRAVLAADTESDTCFLKIDASGLKPLPLRPGARAGERVYCLSHPGGYFFMFTQGMVARLNRRQNDALDEHGKTNGLLTRPILFLNVTAEFAPGSSGAPIVDEAGNVLGQVASIADAGEPPEDGDENAPASPSVPVRFCTATEEILRLNQAPVVQAPKAKVRRPAAGVDASKR
jgi:hypothetical protein